MRIWRLLYDLLAAPGSGAVLITVYEAAGSTPCEAGTRMVAASDGRLFGTIGGGMLEWQATGEARAALDGQSAGSCWQSKKLLGPDLAQCCGGAVTLLFEHFAHADLPVLTPLAQAEEQGAFATRSVIGGDGRVVREISREIPLGGGNDLEVPGQGGFMERFGDASTPLLLFGAGHVGSALVRVLEPLPFDVTWVDSRDGVFPAALPANVRSIQLDEPVAAIQRAEGHSLVLVMTHSHTLDLELVAGALARGTFPYVGLIGSGSKCARFRKRLRERGISGSGLDRLTCPIGVQGLRGKAPAVIAVAVAAQLLTVTEPSTDSGAVAPVG